MKDNATPAIELILRHEGGFVDHPRDPGGATNLGVTIGTLRRLGMDLDGDGDVDVADLRRLTTHDAIKVYKRFYWDAVSADLLPSGVDYAVADYAVNSGPNRAAKELQRCLGFTGANVDGVVGPKTLAAVERHSPAGLVHAICDRRLAFMKRLKHWPTFKNGWTRRVAEVRRVSNEWAMMKGPTKAPIPEPASDPARPTGNFWTDLWAVLLAAIR